MLEKEMRRHQYARKQMEHIEALLGIPPDKLLGSKLEVEGSLSEDESIHYRAIYTDNGWELEQRIEICREKRDDEYLDRHVNMMLSRSAVEWLLSQSDPPIPAEMDATPSELFARRLSSLAKDRYKRMMNGGHNEL